MGCSNSSSDSENTTTSSKNKYSGGESTTDINAASPTTTSANNNQQVKSPSAPQKKQNTWMMDGESDDSSSDGGGDGGDFTTPARKESGLQIKHDLKLTNTNSSIKRRASSLVAHSSLPETAGVPRDTTCADDDDDAAAAGEDEVVLFDSDNDDDDNVGIAGKSHPMGNKANSNKLNTSSSNAKSTTFSEDLNDSKDSKHRPLGKAGKTTSKLASLIAVRHDGGEDKDHCQDRGGDLKDSIEEVAL